MIRTKTELRYYLEQDRIALKKKKPTIKSRLIALFFPDHVYMFQRVLRHAEYYHNQKKTLLTLPFYAYYFIRYKRKGLQLGFSIPLNVFGPGLAIVHAGTIVVNPQAKIGANCRIHVCTNIGTSGGSAIAPVIGDNVYIAPGVKIYGAIKICNNVAFAANAAVSKNVTEENCLYGGVPAKKIAEVDMKKLLKHL